MISTTPYIFPADFDSLKFSAEGEKVKAVESRPGGEALEWLGAVGILLSEAAAGFLALDLIFRYMSLAESGFRERVRRLGWVYAALAALFVCSGGYAQWRIAGTGGTAFLVLDWAPWWLLWRFGLRKQLGFLFWDQDTKKPTSD